PAAMSEMPTGETPPSVARAHGRSRRVAQCRVMLAVMAGEGGETGRGESTRPGRARGGEAPKGDTARVGHGRGGGGQDREGHARRSHQGERIHHLARQLGDRAEPPADADEAQPEEGPGQPREIQDHESERGRCSQRDSGTTRTMTRAVLMWSGPTRRKMAAERSSDLRSRIAARIIRPVVTNTSPTTAAPMPRMAEVAWGVKPTWKYSQVRARR